MHLTFCEAFGKSQIIWASPVLLLFTLGLCKQKYIFQQINPENIDLGFPRPLFRLFLSFSNKRHNFYKYLSIQYLMLGFESTTFRKWILSHNLPYLV